MLYFIYNEVEKVWEEGRKKGGKKGKKEIREGRRKGGREGLEGGKTDHSLVHAKQDWQEESFQLPVRQRLSRKGSVAQCKEH